MLGDYKFVQISIKQISQKYPLHLSPRFDKETNGLKMQLDANMFPVPVHVEASYFNDTNSNTLERKVGGSIKLNVTGAYHKL